MSAWTHRICADCYIDKVRELDLSLPPVRMAEVPPEEPCCFCGWTIINFAGRGGIYIRHDPAELHCKGEHAD